MSETHQTWEHEREFLATMIRRLTQALVERRTTGEAAIRAAGKITNAAKRLAELSNETDL